MSLRSLPLPSTTSHRPRNAGEQGREQAEGGGRSPSPPADTCALPGLLRSFDNSCCPTIRTTHAIPLSPPFPAGADRSASACLWAANRPHGRSAMDPKVSASNVTVCVGAHPRLGEQRIADVDVLFVACLLLGERLEHHSESSDRWSAMKLGSGWGIFCFAMGKALVLSLLLSGCASSRPQPTSAAATDGWGRCDRSRMVSFMLFCRQTTAEPGSDLTR